MPLLPISSIIIAKNAEKTIEDCLKSVQRNNPAEIIIVDDKSTDRTLEIARRYTDRIYSAEGKGVGFARQLGVEQASQEYISYVDSDIILSDGALDTMLHELKAGGCANIQARIRAVKCDTYWEWATDQHLIIRQSRVTGGICAGLVGRDVVLQIRFAPFLKGGEDYDFLYRAEKAGHKTCNSSAIAYHVHRADFRSFVKQRLWYGRSKAQLIPKLGLNKVELWAPLIMGYWLVFCLIRGKLKLMPYFLLGGMAETAGMIKGLLETLQTREKEAAEWTSSK